MDLYFKKQSQIDSYKNRVIEEYPFIWSRIIKEWKSPGSLDRAWLTYSANYLFRTNNVRWAIDPFTIYSRISSAQMINVGNDLGELSFVILTHHHKDHLDLNIIQDLNKLAIPWIVPEPMVDIVEKAGLNPDFILVPQVLETIEISGVKIIPFDGLHFHKGKNEETFGVPAMGYLIESGNKRWLFPGDTRNFKSNQIPDFGPVDIVFAHLWLGKGGALMKEPPFINEFCQFYVDLMPKKIFLTHLREIGRDANDYWDLGHAELAISRFRKTAPNIKISTISLGEGVIL